MDDMVKELLERIRDTACEAADAAAGTARVAGKRAGQMVDIAKLNVQLFDLNSELNDVLRQLGQVMYNTHLGQVADGSSVSTLLEKADRLTQKVEDLKGRIADLRGSQTCPVCGSSCGKDDKFCRRCGTTLE